MRLLREYGWTPAARYVSQVPGMNSRLDEVQAAILRAKLRHLDEWTQRRRSAAGWYADTLPADVTHARGGATDCEHVYHLYVVRVPERDAVRARLAEAGVGTGVHYPVPIHRQPAYRPMDGESVQLPQTERGGR